jgi:hypothetical protein
MIGEQVSETTLAQGTEPGERAPADAKRPRRLRLVTPGEGAGLPGQALAVVACLGVGLLVLLVGLVTAQPVETSPDPWHPTRVLVYALLLLGPGAVFWAVSRALRLGFFWVFGTLAWAALGAVLIFGTPPPRGAAGPGDYGVVLTVFGLALVAAFTPPLFWLNARIMTARLARSDLRRPLRQAILLALGVVACALMLAFGVLNGLNLLLLFTVLALAEFFFLSRG